MYVDDEIENLLCSMAASEIKPGLERIRRLLYLLGNPESRLKLIHIVGTNGKGSTCAALSSILNSFGMKVGLYTSPHLVTISERLRYCERDVDNDLMLSCIRRTADVMLSDSLLKNDPPSYFEVFTAAAFELFAKIGADVLVMEAGLGGRLDATNAPFVTHLSVLTPLSMDHMEYLGNSIQDIAKEKTAIFRRGVPVVSNAGADLERIVKERAIEMQVGYFVDVNKDSIRKIHSCSIDGSLFSLESKKLGFSYDNLFFPLIGPHQVANASTAVIAARLFLGKDKTDNEDGISRIKMGLTNTKWPGRLQLLSRSPLLILDGAHNPGGIETLVDAFTNTKGLESPIDLIMAVMKDKDYRTMLRMLKGITGKIHAVNVPGNPRSLSADELARAAKEIWSDNGPSVESYNSPFDAIRYVSSAGRPALIAGSLYLAGWVLSNVYNNEDHR